jgi:hypothetical protein
MEDVTFDIIVKQTLWSFGIKTVSINNISGLLCRGRRKMMKCYVVAFSISFVLEILLRSLLIWK